MSIDKVRAWRDGGECPTDDEFRNAMVLWAMEWHDWRFKGYETNANEVRAELLDLVENLDGLC